MPRGPWGYTKPSQVYLQTWRREKALGISRYPDCPGHGVLDREAKMDEVGDSYKGLAIRLDALSSGHGFFVMPSTFSDRGKGTQVL